MEISYSSTEGEQQVTIEYEGESYTATRTVGSEENYQFDSPNEVPTDVRDRVSQMNPEGINDAESNTEAEDGGSN